MEIHVQAPAKVNLHLEVLGRRQDGYHEILSLFQLTSLYDELTFRSLKNGPVIDLQGSFDCRPQENLIVRAVEAFRKATGRRDGLRVEVEKRIPVGAGLGGGSSDAAATLWALERLWGVRLGRRRMLDLAGSLGSDVPFFLAMVTEEGAAAVVRGRGEAVQPLPARTDFCLLLALPSFSVSTAAAYGWWDERRRGNRTAEAPEGSGGAARLERMYRDEPVHEWWMVNSLETVVESRFPGIAEARARMLRAGALQARMSGSGSTVFGIFADRSAAARAERGLAGPDCQFMTVNPLAKPAELRLN